VALTGLDIFKKLPKTNCGECGVPTCMAFAMKLASRQAEIDACPYVSDDVKAELSEASAAPVRKVTIGAGDYAFNIGEETVLFRHEKTFVNPAVFGVVIDDSADEDTITAKARAAQDIEFERIEQKLRPRAVGIKASSGSAEKFASAVDKVAANTQLPLVLMADDAAVLRPALEKVKDRKPLIYAADAGNYQALAGLATEMGLPLAVKGATLEELADVSDKVAAAGVKDIVLAPSSGDPVESLKDLVQIRRSALKQKFKPFGYPAITFPGGGDADIELAVAGIHLMKYGGLIMLNELDPARIMPLVVLGQNIYTDPQKPMQMSEGIYPIGDPKEDSPLMVTTNFSLTYFIVSGEVEASRVPAWLLVMDVEGLSVLTAWAAGKFVPEKIAQFIGKSEIAGKLNHKKLVIPGYVAQISGELEEEMPGWNITVGPREAGDLPHYLKSWSAN